MAIFISSKFKVQSSKLMAGWLVFCICWAFLPLLAAPWTRMALQKPLAAPSGFSGTVFYVDSATGNNANNGLSSAAAWASNSYAFTNSHFLSAISTGNVQVIFTSGEVFPGTNCIITNLNPSPYYVAITSSGSGHAIWSNWNNSGSSILGIGFSACVIDSSYIYFTNIDAVGNKTFYNDGNGNEEGFLVLGSSKLTHDIIFTDCNSYWHELDGFELSGDFQSTAKSYISNVWAVNCVGYSNQNKGLHFDDWNGSASDLCNVRCGFSNCVATNIPGWSGAPAYGFYVSNITNGYVWNCVAGKGGNGPANTSGEYDGNALILYECANVHAIWGEYYDWSNNDTATDFVGESANGATLDEGCIDCSLQYLYCHNNQGTGIAEYSGVGSNLIRYCVSISNCLNMDVVGGSGIGPSEFVLTPNGGVNATNVAVYNNAFIATVVGVGAVSNVSSTGSWLTNNVLWASNCVPSMTLGGSTWKAGYNDYYEGGGAAFHVNVNGIAYASISAWGGDAHALTSNPLWSNGLVAPIFYPLSPTTSTNWIPTISTSPLLSAGILIANNGGLDFNSNAVSSSSAPNVGPVQ